MKTSNAETQIISSAVSVPLPSLVFLVSQYFMVGKVAFQVMYVPILQIKFPIGSRLLLVQHYSGFREGAKRNLTCLKKM